MPKSATVARQQQREKGQISFTALADDSENRLLLASAGQTAGKVSVAGRRLLWGASRVNAETESFLDMRELFRQDSPPYGVACTIARRGIRRSTWRPAECLLQPETMLLRVTG
jgi:hypothetical protein